MLNKYLQTLEYPKILNKLAEHTRFSAGKSLAYNLKPTANFETARELQAETTEARHLFSVKPDVGMGGAQDIRPLIHHARRAIILQTDEILAIRRTLIAARDLRRKLTRLEDQIPRLANIAWRLEESAGLVNQISQTIDDAGRVRDNASPALAQIRREIDIAHSRLMEKMRRIAASESVGKYLQEGFITQRDGRYVIPLKTDFKGRVKGVVHGQSASGATTFIEPIPAVELNNKWRELQLEEEKEINRILAALAQKVAAEGDAIISTVEALAELDLIFARARYAERSLAVEPILLNWPADSAGVSRISLKRARHPLIETETVVPINLTLEPETSMLVITGPNTGGKTVSLKTVGLLALMAQSGLHIPANEGSSLMVFDAVYSDIGDEQSLEQSLSTFSAHMTNIVSILEACTPKSLLVFDELGAGTDPIEGAALARSILNHLLPRQITTLVATHFAELKAFAYTAPGVANASMEFNLKTLSPTYKLQLGVPGSSNAFAIADRLGLEESILQSAQGLIGEDAKEVELMLAQIKADKDAARMDRLRVDEELAEAEYYRQNTEARLAKSDEESEAIVEAARLQAQKELAETRAELKQLKRQAKKAASKAAKTPPGGGSQRQKSVAAQMQDMEAELDKLQASIAAEAKPSTAANIPAQRKKLKVGSKVDIPHLNSKGVVTTINKNDIEVQLGHFRTTLKRGQLKAIDQPAEEAAPVSSGGTSGPDVDSPGFELDLRGQISEDALHKLDGYLDQAYLSGLPFVRIIHGKGSGTLRRVVREALSEHPLISSYNSGGQKDGGDGVTMAKLAN